ncbi:MAG: DUF1080 domain-containing protein [Bacteroidales bacterium]|nr:DUF1080 domain-containing protein [Bacteroidales bacterium]
MKNLILAFSLVTALLIGNSCSESKKSIDLFNGKDLTGWNYFVEGNDEDKANEVYTVKDGVIRIAGQPFGCMYTDQAYSDYDLHVEWRYPETAGLDEKLINSGIFLHVQPAHKLWPNAIECQLFTGHAGDFVLLGGSELAEFTVPEGETRPEYPVVPKIKESNEKPYGEWNSADIRCEGDQITVTINGTLQNKGTKPTYTSGAIGLQSEGAPIEFRNVRLTPLK